MKELWPKTESMKVTSNVLVLSSDSPHYKIPPVWTQITFTELSRNRRTLLYFAVWVFLWTEQDQTKPNRGWTRTDQRRITSLQAGREREREDNRSDISRPHNYQSVWMLPDLTLKMNKTPKGIAWHFEKYAHLLSYWELDEKIDVSAVAMVIDIQISVWMLLFLGFFFIITPKISNSPWNIGLHMSKFIFRGYGCNLFDVNYCTFCSRFR